jgi:nucleoside-diphosphate-sugar epimerase
VKYVVTGAAGFIGSHLAEALLERGHEVLGVDSFTDYYDPELKEENAGALDVLRVDLADEPVNLAGVDGIFHLAGQPGVRASWDDFDVYLRRNLLASRQVFGAAAERGVRVVFASSSSVYGEAESHPTREEAAPLPISPYGITKLGCEHLARACGIDAVVLRYFTVYGPRQRPDMAFARIFAALADGSPFQVYGDGGQSRGFTYVADAVDATIAAMEGAAGGTVYNVGGGAEARLQEAIEIAEQVSGRKLDLHFLPAAAGDARRTSADTSRIRGDLGWEAKTALEDGLAAQWDWASTRVGAR